MFSKINIVRSLIVFLLPFQSVTAQTDTNKVKGKNKNISISIQPSGQSYGISTESAPKYDSIYVRKYNNRLVVSLFQSTRSYNVLFTQKLVSGSGIDTLSTSNYVAQANNVTGLSFDYDKISFSLGKSTPLTSDDVYKKGKTSYSDYGFSFSGSKYRLESSYRRYQGFYDDRTHFYDTAYTAKSPYYQNPSLSTRSFKVKGLYFMNKKHRFSYSSSYSNTSRQLKTAGSFILVGNIYNFYMHSDSLIIPPQMRSYYGTWAGVNYFNLYGLSFGAGYTFNLVLWKRIFLNLTLTAGWEVQHRYYKNDIAAFSKQEWSHSFSLIDGRTALGYNGRKFFISVTSITDYNVYDLKSMKFEVKFLSGSFNIGYRFPLKEYKPIKKMKENKYYKMF